MPVPVTIRCRALRDFNAIVHRSRAKAKHTDTGTENGLAEQKAPAAAKRDTSGRRQAADMQAGDPPSRNIAGKRNTRKAGSLAPSEAVPERKRRTATTGQESRAWDRQTDRARAAHNLRWTQSAAGGQGHPTDGPRPRITCVQCGRRWATAFWILVSPPRG